MQKVNPTQTKAWKALQEHFNEVKNLEMKTLFEDDSRAEAFSISWEDFYVDYSKNRITSTTKSLLLDLAKEMNLEDAKHAYFNGSEINETEGRAVMHTALRQPAQATVEIDGQNVITEVNEVKEKIKGFCDTVISGSHKGFTGKAITDVVNIGIGGSDLGPNMVAEALAYYHNHLKVHFISNVDGDHVHESLKYLNPETTLFVIVSKTFTTQETLSNANTARKWFLSKVAGTVQEGEAVAKHFVAVSTNEEAVKEFGIDPNNVFTMWDWVGGRFSLWSSVGLSIALAVGFENFDKMLAGAHKADEHFKNTDLEENIPVLMALVTVWYNNFFKAESEAIIPYSQYLNRFAAYLQQAIMESNGKSVDRNGNPVDYQTGQIVWGEPGTNSQHAFFQLIHQGTKLIPTHFIGFKNSLHGDIDHHNKLMANFFAQTEALMNGKTEEEAREELESTNMDASAMIAIYEHKIFTEGILWNIFSYDQWGVELGKQLAKNVLTDLNSDSIASHDSSTTSLINRFKS